MTREELLEKNEKMWMHRYLAYFLAAESVINNARNVNLNSYSGFGKIDRMVKELGEHPQLRSRTKQVARREWHKHIPLEFGEKRDSRNIWGIRTGKTVICKKCKKKVPVEWTIDGVCNGCRPVLRCMR